MASRQRQFMVLLAVAPAVATISLAWAWLEAPVSWPAFAAAGALALVPALARTDTWRLGLSSVGFVVVLAVVFDTWPHRGLDRAWVALHDAPAVRAPFDPAAYPSLHGLVALAAFGLALAVTLGALARSIPTVVTAVTVGVGFPATLLEDAHALRLGALALASVLWASVVLRVRAPRRALPGLALATILVVAASAVAAGGVAPGETHIDWRGWDPLARGGDTASYRFVWDANYAGISFPSRPTVVFRVRAPKRASYWRASTLDMFVADRWIENLYPVETGSAQGALPPDPLVPKRDAHPGRWLRQQVTIEALDDDHVVAAADPARIEGWPSLGQLSYLSGGVMRARAPVRRGSRYTVWSYAPSPSPRDLAASPARYPQAAARYLELERARFPGFGVAEREARVDRVFTDERYQPLWAYRPVWQDARRITSTARSPYEATLLVERWFRSQGGFRYEERPPAGTGNPPLVDFVEVTKAGYCQHFAGAMSVMLRLLGIPARVAVGFTAGTWQGGVWTVTDYQAHAWVEAWFAGYGWLAFDPTPGRGTLSAVYTLASDSADAVAALGTGRFLDFDPAFTRTPARPVPDTTPSADENGVAWWVIAIPVLPLAAAFLLVAAKWARRTTRLRRRDPRSLASGVRAELLDALVDRGVSVDRNVTATALQRSAERALATPCGSLAHAIAEARYGPAERAGAAAGRARDELRRTLAFARSRERPGDRLRAALSLRSLRPGLTSSAR